MKYDNDTSYPASVATRVAGVKPVTLRAWRNRIGLLDGDKGAAHRFCLRDICQIRAVVILTQHGIPAANAILISQIMFGSEMWEVLEERQHEGPALFAVVKHQVKDGKFKGDESWIPLPLPDPIDKRIGHILKKYGAVFTVIDGCRIIEDVLEGLRKMKKLGGKGKAE